MRAWLEIFLYQWWFSGSLVDDAIMMLKYVFIFLLISIIITYAPCIFDQSNAGPYLNGCYKYRRLW